MQNTQQINQCIQTCTQAANSLRSTANTVTDPGVRDMLTQGAHHIEQCIRLCQSATQMP